MHHPDTMPVRRLRPLALAIALLAPLAVPGAALVHAQENQRPLKHYDLPSGPLDASLTRIARQAGRVIVIDPQLVSNLKSSPVHGELTAEQALSRALAGSGLGLTVSDNGSFGLRRLKSGEEATLAPLTVTSRSAREDAWGPVGGYVAKRSATATKTDTPLLEVPQSISVVGREEMDTRGAVNVEEALRYTPGVGVPYGFDTRYDWLTLRGFDAKSGMYRDGLLQATSTYGIPRADAYTLERVEVLRGPASVLYGQAEPGGVINMVSKKPAETPQRELQLRVGSHRLAELAGDFSGALDERGALRYRMIFVGNQTDTEVDKTYARRRLLAPSLSWQISEATELTVRALYQQDDGDFAFNEHFSPYALHYLRPLGMLKDTDAGFYKGEEKFNNIDRKYTSLGYQLNHRINDNWSFRQNLRYDHIDFDYRYLTMSGVNPFNAQVVLRQANINDERLAAWAVDNQVQGDFATGTVAHTLLLGVDWRKSRADELRRSGNAPSLDTANPVYGLPVSYPTTVNYDNTIDSRQLGVYAQDQLKLDEHWRLTLGGRYDNASREATSRLNGSTSKTTDHAWTGRAGLTYLFANGLAPYLSYSESFKPVGGTDADGRTFKPELGRQYEIGVKYQPSGTQLSLNFALFDIVKQDYVLTDYSSISTGVRRQIGEVTSRGAEIEARAELPGGFKLSAFYSYTDARVSESRNPWEQDARLNHVPKHNAALWVDYTQHGGSLDRLGGGLGIRYVGRSEYTAVNSLAAYNALLPPAQRMGAVANVESAAYTLVDAALRYNFDKVKLALNVSNLFDKKHDTACLESVCYAGYGRMTTLTASYAW